MNRSCAYGTCHSSTAKGAARNGAPVGLDFDLVPVTGSTHTDARGNTTVELDPEQIAGLRERRNNVFNVRNLIWQQVRDGLMPPDGMFARFKSLVAIFDSDEDTPCTVRSDAFDDVDSKASQDVLRNWLACRAPIVEANGEVERDGVPGTAGYQYLACEDAPIGDGGAGDITLDTVFTRVFDGDGFCTGCHPSVADEYPLDLSDLDKAYETLLDDGERCNGKPYVTPGDPDKSFLIDVLTLSNPGCDISRMPDGFDEPLADEEIQLVRDWIEQGAKPSTDKSRASRALKLGLDAGSR
jgi:hypothetical protein